MLGLGPIAFAAPWVLTALALLPVLYWLLRVTPPAPRLMQFPAIRLLRDLVTPEETPARTPWWLLALRILIAALIILALAGPLMNPRAALPGSGPLLLIVDNGWAAAPDWTERRAAIEELAARAERQNRPVVLLATAPPATAEAIAATVPLPGPEARRMIQLLEPRPWPTDRAAAAVALQAYGNGPGRDLAAPHIVWISDGIRDGRAGRDEAAAATRLAEVAQRLGRVEVMEGPSERKPHLLLPPGNDSGDLTATILRADDRLPDVVSVRVAAEDGRLLTRETVTLAAGTRQQAVQLTLPAELRGEAASLRIEGENGAGAVVLLDERWRRRPVGLVSGRSDGESQPLLSDLHYLDRALSPFNEVRRGDVRSLLRRDLAVLILSDIGALTGEEERAISDWIDQGGLLLRFAGSRMAQAGDALVPVRLRLGDRALGGALSWSEPARLAEFDRSSPFFGLRIPPDVLINRQVLAEPSIDLADRSWARLVDGTPLVTSEKRGDGWVVLVHTSASPDWSNLPISGLFVDMLRRLVGMSGGVTGTPASGTLDPLDLLDGQGRMMPAPPTAFPLPANAGQDAVSPRHPPGFYGTDDARRALNLAPLLRSIDTLGPLPAGIGRAVIGDRGERDLKPLLLGLGFGLLLLDFLIALALRGLIGRRKVQTGKVRTTAAVLGAVAIATGALVWPPPVARADDAQAVKVTEETYLAHVRTGDQMVDDTARAGLEALVEVLNRRTAVETAGAVMVDLEADELSFYPLLYWPVSASQTALSDRARERVNDYLRNGGTILIDTRDNAFGYGGGARPLQGLADGLDIPPLAPIPPDHVLAKSFYLLNDFPGRQIGSELWVEAREGTTNDGVSPVIVGGNDWASAWAQDRRGQPMFAVIPGGERQREMAYRFGVNVVMYALTGNYKADQVHVPVILERLGQ